MAAMDVCGYLEGGQYYWAPIFPFREQTSEGIEFCRKNIKNVESACNITVDELLIEDLTGNDTYACDYVMLNSSGQPIKKYVKLNWFSESFLKSYADKSASSSQFEVYEIDLNKSYSPKCNNLNETFTYS